MFFFALVKSPVKLYNISSKIGDSMNFNKITYLVIFSIIYMTTLIVIYLSKERINNEENGVYRVALFTNLIGLFLQLACDFVIQKSNIVVLLLSIWLLFLLKNIIKSMILLLV